MSEGWGYVQSENHPGSAPELPAGETLRVSGVGDSLPVGLNLQFISFRNHSVER